MKITLFSSFLSVAVGVAMANPLNEGDNEVQPLIYRGDQAVQGEFPYFVDLATCGAQIIAPRVVMSAAHCEDPGNKKNLIIGAMKPGDSSAPAETRNCVLWLNHPGWDGDINNGNDYALCLLDRPVETLDSSRNTTLVLNEDPNFPAVGDTAVACGMGYKNFFFQTPNILLKNEMPVIPTEQCGPGNVGFEDVTVLCTRDRSTSICPGDSGGPLVTISRNPDGSIVHTLVGLSSFIYGFCPSDWSGFARISAAMPWVKENVCGNGIYAKFCPIPSNCADDPTWSRGSQTCATIAARNPGTRFRNCRRLPGAMEACPATCDENCAAH